MRLIPLEERLAVCRLDANSEMPIPDDSTLFSITRTSDELSIVCPEDDTPENAEVERGWRALKVAGPLEFSEVGVISTLAAPLAEAGVSVFVVSTFETDYLLVKAGRLEETVAALREDGHEVSKGPEIHPFSSEDLDFLWEMLYEAVHAPPGESKPSRNELFADPAMRRYLEGWGREDDAAFVAFGERGERLGAVWRRLMGPEEPGYGYIDARTPEISIAVAPGSRGRGFGERLMEAMISSSRNAGYAALGLSVDHSNPARRLYERLGFRVLEDRETDHLMKLDLKLTNG